LKIEFFSFAAAALVALAGCAVMNNSAGDRAPVVLAQAEGICPSYVVYVPAPDACQLTHQWNGTTHIFSTPHRQWGVAYAYNCGSRAREFSFDERLTAMDHMAIAGVYRHTRSGAGYVMISKRRMTDLVKAVPQEFKGDDAYMEVDIASPCTWHVKAILGSQHDVAQAVPPVPAMQSPWWEKKHPSR
jgi:hypothetical protein